MIERIIDHRRADDDELLLRVHWSEYPREESTWEPVSTPNPGRALLQAAQAFASFRNKYYTGGVGRDLQKGDKPNIT